MTAENGAAAPAAAPLASGASPSFRPTEAPPRDPGLSPSEGLDALRKARERNGVGAPEPAPSRPQAEPRGSNGAAQEEEEEALGAPGDIELMLDGRLQRVSMAELQQGYQRQQDYTRKTQALRAQQGEVQQVLAAFQQARDHYLGRLDRFVSDSAKEFDKPVDWVALAKTDPLGWQEKRARYEMLQEAKREQEQVAQQRQLEEQNRKLNLVRAGHAMLSQALPAWKDTAQRQALQQEMAEYARKVGYTEDELAQDIIDPRQIIVLHDAAQYRKLQATKVTPQPHDPGRPAPRGAPPPVQASRRERDARAAFDERPTMRQAFALARTLREIKPTGRR
jgi:hypothetical protein